MNPWPRFASWLILRIKQVLDKLITSRSAVREGPRFYSRTHYLTFADAYFVAVPVPVFPVRAV